jgi:hypothetical protein
MRLRRGSVVRSIELRKRLQFVNIQTARLVRVGLRAHLFAPVNFQYRTDQRRIGLIRTASLFESGDATPGSRLAIAYSIEQSKGLRLFYSRSALK